MQRVLLYSMSDNKSEDALFEALTIDRQFRPAERPHWYCHGRLWSDWWGPTNDSMDIVYYNVDNKMHRLYGPAYISKKFDIEAWYKDGELHRKDGPAYRHKNCRYWYLNGQLHRLDGPAVDAAGHPKEYWIGGQQWSPKNYKKEIERMRRKGLMT